jgi:transaldolase
MSSHLLFTLFIIASFPTATPLASFRGTNRLFLDTAVESEWESLLPLGIFHGITTNPTLLERAGHDCNIESVQHLTKTALSMVGCDEFMCQAWGITAQDMYSVGMNLSSVDRERVVVKVPVTFEGTKTASKLIDAGVRVCLTACYSSDQAIIAAGLGAEYLGECTIMSTSY